MIRDRSHLPIMEECREAWRSSQRLRSESLPLSIVRAVRRVVRRVSKLGSEISALSVVSGAVVSLEALLLCLVSARSP
jgi:hypothetical protein